MRSSISQEEIDLIFLEAVYYDSLAGATDHAIAASQMLTEKKVLPFTIATANRQAHYLISLMRVEVEGAGFGS